jgi:hypothetical protein
MFRLFGPQSVFYHIYLQMHRLNLPSMMNNLINFEIFGENKALFDQIVVIFDRIVVIYRTMCK